MSVYERQVKEEKENKKERDIKDIKKTYREKEGRKRMMSLCWNSGCLPGSKSWPGMGMAQRESAEFIRLSHFHPPQGRLS